MKGLMYLLLLLNASLALLGWLDLRRVSPAPAYVSVDSVHEIALVNEGRLRGELKACWLLGPFIEERRAKSLYSRASGVGLAARVVEDDVVKAPGYWVFYRVEGGYSHSLAKLKEFQVKGIDSFIIGREPLRGNISLGVFENIDSARRMKAIMKGRGYLSELYEFSKSERHYWVRVFVPSEKGEKALFDAVLSAENHPLEKRQVFCK